MASLWRTRVLAISVLMCGFISVDTAVSSPALAVSGCSTGTMTTTREVVGYEFFSYEKSWQGDPSLLNVQRRYTKVVFSASGTTDATCTFVVPTGVTRTHLLVVGGGGAGGTKRGGGGGGGGVYYTKSQALTPGSTLDITVGGGGAAAPVSCTTTSCAGGQGKTSIVSVDGTDIGSASGGGGGGGAEQSAPTVTGVTRMATGGGGGAAAAAIGSSVVLVGASGLSASTTNDPYHYYDGYPGGLSGGYGGAGGNSYASGGITQSGGGGGAKWSQAYSGGYAYGYTGGAYGPHITVTGGTTRYGAGGGGVEIQQAGCGSCFNFAGTASGSPSSGGAGGTSSAAGSGVDGTGGGGGGGGEYTGGTGGRGGSGTVTLWYYDPIDVTGDATLTATKGVAISSNQYTASYGNPNTGFTWSIVNASSQTVSGITVSGSTRRITIATSVAAGTYAMTLRVTDGVATRGTIAVSITVNRGAQAALSFTTTAPTTAKAGGARYAVDLAGGSGTGAYSIGIDAAAYSVCSAEFNGTGIEVSFLTPGTCIIIGDRGGDTQYLDATRVTQSFTVAQRSTQSAVNFTTTAPSSALVGDAGYNVSVDGGSGTGAYAVSIDASSSSVCTLSSSTNGSLVSHIGRGTCVINGTRAGDVDNLTAAVVQQSYSVRGERTLAIDPATLPLVRQWQGSTYDITNMGITASQGTSPAGTWYRDGSSSACTVNVVPVIRIIGTGICDVYAEESDISSFVTSRTPTYRFYVADASDQTAPVASSVSATPSSGTFGVGSQIVITVTFNELVIVNGSPRLRLSVGGATRYATYVDGNYSTTIRFRYTVVNGDQSSRLDYVASNAIDFNGGSIADLMANAYAHTMPSPGTSGSLSNTSFVVVAAAPTVTSVAPTVVTTPPATEPTVPAVANNPTVATTNPPDGANGKAGISSTVSAPLALSYVAGNKQVTLRWSSVSEAVRYRLTQSNGQVKCAVTATMCVVKGLRNGTRYNFAVRAVGANGSESASSIVLAAVPGFQVRATSLNRSKTYALSRLMTSPSKGAMHTSAVGNRCTIAGNKVTTGKKIGTCKIRITVAKWGAYAAMSTTLSLPVK